MSNDKQQTPHGFCETPEQKCTMNYCDENGCQNRKRTLAEPTEIPNNKQQTAVEWFNDEILIHLNFDQRLYLKDIFNQAKEMEKERMIDFAQFYAVIHCMGDITKNADEYYNETYGGNK